MRSLRQHLLILLGVSRIAAGQSTEPRPENAIPAIVAAFDTYRVVALGDSHGTKELNDFVLSLVRDNTFVKTVNDIVVECLNSRLQPLLDRYAGGEDVPLDQARTLWRDQTHPPCSVDDFHRELIELVRRINRGLPEARRLRILAGEPPLDWATTTPTIHQAFLAQRDAHAAEVVSRQVITKNRKALLLYGLGHLFHGMKQMVVGRYEVTFPGVTFVIAPYVGAVSSGQCGAPASAGGKSLDALMASWPNPSLARTRGTVLTDFVANEFARQFSFFGAAAEPVDAYLYLGPARLLLTAPPSATAFLDTSFTSELRRRASVMAGGNFHDDRIEPDKVRGVEAQAFACKGA